jgi:uroporphyrinogen-III synthase
MPPRLIVTRPAAQAGAAVAQLRARGIDAVAVPLIAIVPLADDAALVALWRSLAAQRLVVFVSANAVLRFVAARPAEAPWPESTLAAAPGPGTAEALRAAGVPESAVVEPAADAAQFDSEALWLQLQGRDWQGARVVVVRGETGRDWLGERLADAGADVHSLAAYTRALPTFDADAARIVEAAAAHPEAWLWLFSSSEAIGHLQTVAGPGRWSGSRAIATHPRIAARARQAGFAEVQEVEPGLDAVVACIQSMRP